MILQVNPKILITNPPNPHPTLYKPEHYLPPPKSRTPNTHPTLYKPEHYLPPPKGAQPPALPQTSLAELAEKRDSGVARRKSFWGVPFVLGFRV